MTPWNAITALLDSAAGSYSIAVCTAEGDPIYGYHAHRVCSAASLIKVPLAMAIIDAQLDLDAPVTVVGAEQIDGAGTLDRAVGTVHTTIRALLTHTLTESDNTAANLLIERVGFAAVNDLIERLGLEHTRLRRKFLDFAALAAGCDNTTTAADMCAVLTHLLQPRYAELVALLSRAVGDGKLEAGVPPDTLVAHKVGNLDAPVVEHDAGIVFAPNAPYIVALLGVDLPGSEQGRQTLARTSALIWQGMTAH